MEQKRLDISFRGTKYPCFYITEFPSAIEFIDKLLAKDTMMAVDFETMALRKYRNIGMAALSPHLSRPRLLQVFTGKTVTVFDFKKIRSSTTKQSYAKFKKKIIEFYDTKRMVAHYANFELQFMLKAGATTPNVACTLLLAKLVVQAGRPIDISYSLGALVKGFLGIEIPKAHGASDWGVRDLTHEQIEYAAIDAIATLELAKVLKRGIVMTDQGGYYQLIHKAMPVVADMQLTGCLFDMESHWDLIIEWRQELYETIQEIQEITKLPKITGPKIADWLDENLDKKDKFVWPRSDKSKRLSVDAATLSDFEHLPIVAPFSRYQKLSTLTSRYGKNLAQFINASSGRIHGQYSLVGARTGRMSSSRPNEQNAPKDTRYRSKYIAAPGNIFCRADYSQIEIRAIAELSQDKVMLDAFAKGEDFHDVTGAGIMGVSIPEFKAHPDYDHQRRFAKALNFLLQFGGGAETYAMYSKKNFKVEKSLEEAWDDINKWKSLYAGVTEWQQKQAAQAEKTLMTWTPMGKKRKLPANAYYGASMNTPVQGGAAECIMLSLVYIYDILREKGSKGKIIKCVHDEIVVECPDNKREIKTCSDAIVTGMTDAFLAVFPGGITKNLVDVTTGHDWAEACKE